MPLSLNEPVGLSPSTLSHTSQPVASDSQFEATSGVPPSPRVTTGVVGSTGNQERNSSITPRHGRERPAISPLSLVAEPLYLAWSGSAPHSLRGRPARPSRTDHSTHLSPSPSTLHGRVRLL